MSTTDVRSDGSASESVTKVDMKLEVVVIAVSDVDRAKEFYTRLGWRLDADFAHGENRVVQFTPPGSPGSVHFGAGLTSAEPGSAKNVYLVVSDIQAARDELIARGIDVSEVFHYAGGPAGFGEKVRGAEPENRSYGSFASFRDPDGNSWLMQQITTRLPGRIDATGASFAGLRDLADAMRRAEAAHGEHEKRTGVRDEDWPTWYATYMAAEQSGADLPT